MSRGLDLPGEATPYSSVLRRCRSEMRFINWPSAHRIFVCMFWALRMSMQRGLSQNGYSRTQPGARVSEYFKKKLLGPRK